MPIGPAVSVVVPLYNKERHVARAIQSVLDQAFDDFELIVVNDGSTDGSVEVVKTFKDPRIRLVHREHVNSGGGHAARNLGIAESRACLIAFLVNGLTESSLYYSRVTLIFWYLVGVSLGLKKFGYGDQSVKN